MVRFVHPVVFICICIRFAYRENEWNLTATKRKENNLWGEDDKDYNRECKAHMWWMDDVMEDFIQLFPYFAILKENS